MQFFNVREAKTPHRNGHVCNNCLIVLDYQELGNMHGTQIGDD